MILRPTLNFAPNIGPAMSKDTDDTDAVDLLIDVLAAPGNRLNANIVTAAEDGIHWNAVRQAARLIRTVGERSANGQGKFNFAAIAMVKPYGPFYPGAWHPAGGPNRFAIGLEAASVVMDVFAREHDPRRAVKALEEALNVHARAVESAALKAAAGGVWTYAGIDPTPAPGGAVSIGSAIESFTGAPSARRDRDSGWNHHNSRKGRGCEADGVFGTNDPCARRRSSDAAMDRSDLQPGFDSGLLRRVCSGYRHRHLLVTQARTLSHESWAM